LTFSKVAIIKCVAFIRSNSLYHCSIRSRFLFDIFFFFILFRNGTHGKSLLSNFRCRCLRSTSLIFRLLLFFVLVLVIIFFSINQFVKFLQLVSNDITRFFQLLSASILFLDDVIARNARIAVGVGYFEVDFNTRRFNILGNAFNFLI